MQPQLPIATIRITHAASLSPVLQPRTRYQQPFETYPHRFPVSVVLKRTIYQCRLTYGVKTSTFVIAFAVRISEQKFLYGTELGERSTWLSKSRNRIRILFDCAVNSVISPNSQISRLYDNVTECKSLSHTEKVLVTAQIK